MAGRLIRSLIVHAPFLQEAAAAAKREALAIAKRPFEPEFSVLAGLEIGEGECLVDVGANRGQSIDAMRLYHPPAPIVAFEPQSALAAMLHERYAGNNVEVRAAGLGTETRSLTLFTPHYAGWRFDGLASLDRSEAESWLNARTVIGFDAAKLALHEETVAVRRLDDEGLSPAFMKFDIQGAESAALKGGAATIKRFKPVLLVETGVNEGLVRQIEGLGYDAYNVVHERLVPRLHQVRNAVFVHPERARGLERSGARISG
jgi:FkbM family methyltransferase